MVRGATTFLGIDTDWWGAAGALVAILGAVGGIIATAWRWCGRSRLELSLTQDGRAVEAWMYWNEKFPRAKLAMIRLDVTNVGRSTAESVFVRVNRVLSASDGGCIEKPEHVALRHLPLAWSSTDLRNPQAEGQSRDLASGDPGQVDVVHVNEARPAQLHLDTRPRLPSDPQWLNESRVLLELDVTMADARPKHYEATVDLREPWTDPTKPARLKVALELVRRRRPSS